MANLREEGELPGLLYIFIFSAKCPFNAFKISFPAMIGLKESFRLIKSKIPPGFHWIFPLIHFLKVRESSSNFARFHIVKFCWPLFMTGKHRQNKGDIERNSKKNKYTEREERGKRLKESKR